MLKFRKIYSSHNLLMPGGKLCTTCYKHILNTEWTVSVVLQSCKGEKKDPVSEESAAKGM